MSIENYGAFKYYNCFFLIWPLSRKWRSIVEAKIIMLIWQLCYTCIAWSQPIIFCETSLKLFTNHGSLEASQQNRYVFFYLCKYIEKFILCKFIIKIHNYDSFLTELNLFWELHCPFWDFPPSSVNKNKITFQTNAPICMQSVLLLLIALRGSKMQKTFC